MEQIPSEQQENKEQLRAARQKVVEISPKFQEGWNPTKEELVESYNQYAGSKIQEATQVMRAAGVPKAFTIAQSQNHSTLEFMAALRQLDDLASSEE